MEQWKNTVYVCVLGAFLTSMGVSQVAPILPIFLPELGVTEQDKVALWSGITFGVTYLMIALTAPFWGRLSDKKGRKIILLRASLGMAITNLLTSFVTSPEQLALIRLIQGTVSGFFSGSITLVATETPKDHSGWALGILSSANLAGALVGPLIGGYLAGIFGIRSTFFIISASLFISFLLVFFMVHESYEPNKETKKLSFAELKEELVDYKSLAMMAVTTFIYSISFLALQPILTIFVQKLLPENVGHIALIAGIAFSATGFAQMLTSSVLGKTIDNIGPRKVLIISLLYAGILTIPQAYVTNIYQFIILRFLLGIGLGGLLPGITTYIAMHSPTHLKGQAFSYNQTAQFLGYFIGSLGGAQFMALLGFNSLFWITGLLFIGNALWVKFKIKD